MGSIFSRQQSYNIRSPVHRGAVLRPLDFSPDREEHPQTSGTKRHRTEYDTAPETFAKRMRGDQDSSQQVSISASERMAFYQLLKDPSIVQFLNSDICLKMTDNYLLAMTLIYFKRAGLSIEEYTIINFYLALFIANQMEEGHDYYHRIYFTIVKIMKISQFKDATREFFRRMNMRAWVSLEECQKVMEGQYHKVWKRARKVPVGYEDCHQD